MNLFEEALRKDFLPALFGDDSPADTDALREIIQFPVRFGGLGITNPVAQAEQHFQNSVATTTEVSSSLKATRGGEETQISDYPPNLLG